MLVLLGLVQLLLVPEQLRLLPRHLDVPDRVLERQLPLLHRHLPGRLRLLVAADMQRLRNQRGSVPLVPVVRNQVPARCGRNLPVLRVALLAVLGGLVHEHALAVLVALVLLELQHGQQLHVVRLERRVR